MSEITRPPTIGSKEPGVAEPVNAPRKPRRRRWKRRLFIGALVALVLLGGLVALGPTIISTQAGTRTVVGVVNETIRGHLVLDQLSLSWTGPVEIRGVCITDSGGREVVRVSQISMTRGLWRALTGWQAFEGLAIDKPEVLVHVTPDGRITLADALSMRRSSSAKSENQPLPTLHGKLTIRGGVVKIVREQAGSYQVNDVSGDIDLNTLNDLSARVDMGLPGSGKLSCDMKVHNLFGGDKLDLSKASGSIDVRTTPGIDVGPLSALATPGSPVTGSATLALTGHAEKGAIQTDLVAEITNLAGNPKSASSGEPINASLKGNAQWADSKLIARLDLTGKLGSAQASLNYQHASDSVAPSADRVLAAILAGDSIHWPELTLDAKAAIDVGVLGRTFPQLLNIRADRQLTGGRLDVTRLTVNAGARPSVSAVVALADVTALEGTKSLRLSPINVDGDAILETGKGLNVRQFTIKSGFAQVSASGTPSQFRADLKANLAALQGELGQVFDFGGTALAGDLNSTLEVNQSQADRMELTLQAGMSGLRYANGNRSLELAKASLAHGGTMTMVNRRPAKYTARTVALNLNEEVLATGSGEYDWQQKRLSAVLESAKADLAFISSRAAGLGAAGWAGYSGGIQMQARMQYASDSQSVKSDGQLVGKDLNRDGQPLLAGESRLEWSGLSLGPGSQGMHLDKAELQSVPAKLNAHDVGWQSGENAAVQGVVSASADIAGCMAIAAKVAKWQKTPAISGRLQWDTTGALNNQVATVTGQGQIQNFGAGAGTSAVRQEKVEFGYGIRIDPKQNRLVVEKLNLAAKPLSLEATGEIGRYGSDCVLALSGRYEASWPELTALLHELAPSTAATISFSGTSSSPFQIAGAAQKPGARPSFREVGTGLQISWDTADLYGVKTGKAVLSPTLKEGQVVLPSAAIPASQGKVNLAGMIDFQPADATVRIPGRLPLLENVAVTREMGDLLLSRVNPVFSHVTNLQGRANLEMNDVVLPLGEAMNTGGTGRGRLDLRDMRMSPGTLLSELLSLSGQGKATDYPVEIGAVDFTLKNGRIFYDNFSLTFPQQFDLRFRGSVGFDETLDLVVSLPVRPELLTRLKVQGPVDEYARLLAGSRVEVPLSGTREKPNLDFSKVDTAKLLKGVLQKAVGQQGQDLLKKSAGQPGQDLLKKPAGQQGQDPLKKPAGQPGQDPLKKPASQPGQDLLKQLPGGVKPK